MAAHPYATQAQIELAAGGHDRLLAIADWDADGSADATVIAWAQLTADALIDGHAMMRFAALLDGDGAVVDTAAMLAANEAVYQLKLARGQNATQDDTAAASRLALYQAIANGTFRPADPVPSKSGAPSSSWVDRDPTGCGVSREGLKGLW